jgi:beta-galactosidase
LHSHLLIVNAQEKIVMTGKKSCTFQINREPARAAFYLLQMIGNCRWLYSFTIMVLMGMKFNWSPTQMKDQRISLKPILILPLERNWSAFQLGISCWYGILFIPILRIHLSKNPPFIDHADNPVGSYRRTFELPETGANVVFTFILKLGHQLCIYLDKWRKSGL